MILFNTKSSKTGKVKESKTSKTMPVEVFSVDTTTDVFSYDTTHPGDSFSYGTDSFSMPETVIATSKTGKVAKAATDVDSESEDDASSDEASAKSGKNVVAKLVRAMPIESYSGTAANAVVAENAAVINGAGAFFAMLTFAAVGVMMA
mmetsp:Transcript_28231/g.40342  ORF Transcript_28231/g.40342 Transcript_28231/m.40342 type:complete len:148 (+) Transcript_28231:270-713(+)